MGPPTPVPPSDEEKSALVEEIIRGKLTPHQAQQRHDLTRSELEEWVRVYWRKVRRAFDDRVESALSSQGIDTSELAGAEFSGRVEDMSLADLLQTIQLGGKDAEVRIERGRDKSHVWCVAGQVVDAESGQLQGPAAVYRMLSFQRGRIHADFSPVQRPRRVDASTPALLMEGARRVDECNRLRSMLGDMEAVFVPSDRALAPDVQATSEQFAVLRAFDGARTLEDVVTVSPVADLETLTSVLSLRDAGLLEPVRASRTSLRPIPIGAANELAPESSCLPLARSVAHRPSPRPRRWVWIIAACGPATLGAALALRIADERAARASTTAAHAAGPARVSPPEAAPRLEPDQSPPPEASPPDAGLERVPEPSTSLPP